MNSECKTMRNELTISPLSSAVLSSTEAEMTDHRVSMSHRYPRKMGEAADRASYAVGGKRREKDPLCDITSRSICAYHDRAHDGQVVVQMSGLVYVTSLEGHLIYM